MEDGRRGGALHGHARRGMAVAAASAVVSLAALHLARAVRRADIHLARTAQGLAVVRTIADEAGEPVRVLYQGGGYQSATYLGARRFLPVFEYCRGLDTMFDAEPAMRASSGHGIRRALMLGGGGFAYPKHLLTTRDGIHMDVVEIDPGVVEVARRWFFLSELEERLRDPNRSRGNGLAVHVADGRAFLNAAAPGGYDVVINDAFSGTSPVACLATAEAAAAAKACLTPGGLYLANVSSRGEGLDLSFLRDEVATLLTAFAHAHVVPSADETFAGEDNYLVIATDGEYAFADAVPFDGDFLGTVLHDGC